ncbi:hypothetical protein BKA69DRAFT_1047048 [Paraphysoderma sedebokerense]|nr:hypothetical protein BKA69DRAFT_1047048 [Paraphysoderma sedebokerense]
MADKFPYKEGDRVEYRPVEGAQQRTIGVIKRVITEPEEAGTRHTTVKASQDEPRFLIENEHTHKETPYKASAIDRKVETGE